MLTTTSRLGVAGMVAGLATLMLAGPAAARIPEGAVAHQAKHRTTLAGVLATNSLYAAGCKNGTISDRVAGRDNNNYEYYGTPCST